MGKFFAFAAACLMLMSENAAAGWYRVVNYAGFLGADPIHFSLQTYDGFGSGITAEGSYFTDARQSPIALYGKVVGEKLELCEIADDKALDRIVRMGSKTPVDTAGCPFSLTLSDDGATGTWVSGATTYPIALKKVASLDDSGEGKIEGTVEIPFWAQTSAHRLSGTYAKAGAGVCMQKLQIIDKGSRKVVQELSFDKEDCNAGMLMTPIYLNVEEQTRSGADVVSVSFRDNGAGYATDYVFNRATRRYSKKK